MKDSLMGKHWYESLILHGASPKSSQAQVFMDLLDDIAGA